MYNHIAIIYNVNHKIHTHIYILYIYNPIYILYIYNPIAIHSLFHSTNKLGIDNEKTLH